MTLRCLNYHWGNNLVWCHIFIPFKRSSSQLLFIGDVCFSNMTSQCLVCPKILTDMLENTLIVRISSKNNDPSNSICTSESYNLLITLLIVQLTSNELWVGASFQQVISLTTIEKWMIAKWWYLNRWQHHEQILLHDVIFVCLENLSRTAVSIHSRSALSHCVLSWTSFTLHGHKWITKIIN